MKRTLVVAAAAAFGISAPAFSAPGNSYLDGYYVPSAELEIDLPGIGSADDDGDGFGIKGAAELAPQVFLIGEYQSTEYDDSELELDALRIGAGFGAGAGNGGGLYGRIQYIDYEIDNEEESGVGGHIGYALPLSNQFRLYGEVGYLKLDDVDGPEVLGGAAFMLAPNLGIFADYRVTQLEDDNDIELTFEDFRVGARFTF